MNAAAVWSGLATALFVLAVGHLWHRYRAGSGAAGRLLADAAGRDRGMLPGLHRWLGRALRRAGVRWSSTRVVRTWVGAVTVAALAATTLPLAAGVVAVLVTAAGPVLVLHGLRHRADRTAVTQLPVALDGVARALRSGAGMAQAVGEVGATTPPPLGPDLTTAARHPEGLVAGLESWSERHPNAEVHLAAAALCLAAEVGGTASRATEGLASTLRQRAESATELRTLATQSRLSGLVIGILPVGFAVLAAASDAAVAHFLFATPGGAVCLLVGLALDAVGAWWMLHLSSPRAPS